MATDTRNFVLSMADDAAFRAQILGIRSALLAAGAVRTADTGQVDATTVLRPGAVNTIAGYDMFRFSDTLQATKPVFVKLQYGTTAVTQSRFGLTVTVGTATDGAGNLTGTQVSTATLLDMGVSGTFGMYTSASGDSMALFVVNAASSNMGFLVARVKDETGADTGEGVMVLLSNNSIQYVQALPFSAVVPARNGAYAQFGAVGSHSGATNAAFDLAVGSVCTAFSGLWRFIVALLYSSADISALTPFTIAVLGRSRTLLPLGNGAGNGYGGGSANTTTCLCIPWE